VANQLAKLAAVTTQVGCGSLGTVCACAAPPAAAETTTAIKIALHCPIVCPFICMFGKAPTLHPNMLNQTDASQ
jgi:hypothetical protein